MLAALLFAASMQQPQLQEQITVERVIVDARVTDAEGNPITGLKPSDFKVTIDGKPAKVEAADWTPAPETQREIDETAGAAAAPGPAPTPSNPQPQRGRLLVFLYQTDFARNSVRVRGPMQLPA